MTLLHPLHALEILTVRQERVLREDAHADLVGAGGAGHYVDSVASGTILSFNQLELIDLVDMEVAADVGLGEDQFHAHVFRSMT